VRRLPLVALVVLAGCAGVLAGCAGAPLPRAGEARPAADPRCGALWPSASAALAAALDEYLEGMRKFAAARDGASTAAAEGRARTRAIAWEAQHRPEVERGCGAWAPATLACALEAKSARALADCGPEAEALVTSYTDEVVAAFAASPLH